TAAFRDRTRPYEAFVADIRARNASPHEGDVVVASEAVARPIPVLYRDVAAQAAFCMDNLRVEIR
ncbi:MAG: hypothetical protein NTY02_17535, partial [Acidobacteria bacterium]|nr:hypothetical protein [Acidobacteriota bacterium]